jgi:hypothetical protein
MLWWVLLCCRFELDAVIMYAIHPCGRGHAMHTLPQLDQRSNLQRLLLALPPVHRVRLLSMMVVSCILSRCVRHTVTLRCTS